MQPLSKFNSLCPGQIGPIEPMGNGLYTANAIAPTGEKMYMGMESLENDDKNKWEYYKNSASFLVWGGICDMTIGSLAELGSRINDEISLKEFLLIQTNPKYWTSDQQKFEQLIAKLQERQIFVDSTKAKELSTIPYASNGINVSSQTHMVYVSKSPIIGRIQFDSHSKKGFSGYLEKYDDLVLTVGVTISDIVENRGIFRNPWSVVEGGFGAISMMTHCFTCMVVEHNYPGVETFKVRPFKKMGELFMNSLPKDQTTVNGIPGDLYDRGFEYEQDVRVPVKVLANLHRKNI
ncbi:MAG: hypothetical protein H0T62_07770 [Parachlamydiaceae bacterium]|nr:hypothetical protein [Parachlamydiaceae bacterium]